MIVCLCNNLNEAKLNQAKASGAKSPKQAFQALGCAAKCGACSKEICGLLKS